MQLLKKMVRDFQMWPPILIAEYMSFNSDSRMNAIPSSGDG